MAQSSLPTTAQALPIAPRAAQTRRGLAIYFALLIPLSGVFEGLAIITGNVLWVFVLMWMPALASIVARLALREGFADVSFRLGGRQGWRMVGIGFILPSVIGLLAYGTAWALGLAHFAGRTQAFGLPLPPALVFAITVALFSTINVVFSAFLAAGEEIGWRGYLQPRLDAAGFRSSLWIVWLFQLAYHLPLMVGASYVDLGNLPVSFALFAIGDLPFTFIAARECYRARSLWPAVFFHMAGYVALGLFFFAAMRRRGRSWRSLANDALAEEGAAFGRGGVSCHSLRCNPQQPTTLVPTGAKRRAPPPAKRRPLQRSSRVQLPRDGVSHSARIGVERARSAK